MSNTVTYWSPVAYAWLADCSKANNLVNTRGLGCHGRWINPKFWGDDPGLGENYRGGHPRCGSTHTIYFQHTGRCSLRPPSWVTKSEFSHVLQDFGSQQYYELMSKYYQFQPGWQDFHEQRLAQGASHVYQYSWNATMLSERFIEGRDRAEEFNKQYRDASYVLIFLVVNHMISAFDAYFSARLKESRLQMQTGSVLSERAVALVWQF